MQKLYCYVDESGQDTKGRLFVVGIVVLDSEREQVARILEEIEKKSCKRIKKWRKAPYKYRQAYIQGVTKSAELQESLFFEIFFDNKKYLELTSYATAKAIIRKAHGQTYDATIYVEGLTKQEVVIFSRGLRDLDIKRRKVKGVRKEESNVFIRLADALCGLIRDAQEDNVWAKEALHKLQKKKVVTAL